MVKALLLALPILLLAPETTEGQATARARASIVIGEVMSLRVHPGSGQAVLSADGVHRELESAVSLEVLSNRPWQLMVTGSLDRAVAWRVSDAAGDGDRFEAAESVPTVIASGPPGRSEIELDYRWLDAPGRAAEPGTVLHFTLSPR